MNLAILFGMAAGAGVWLIARGLRPTPPPIALALRSLGRPRWPVPETRQQRTVMPARLVNAGARSIRTRAERSEDFARDLAICDRAAERHAIDKLTTATFLGALPVGCWAIAALGGAMLPAIPTLVLAAALGAAGWTMSDVQLRERAKARRNEFTSALSTYLDLVAILLAGGSGIEQSLRDAASGGDNWAFGVISRSLHDAALQARAPWHTMATTADRLGLDSLAELASGMALAGESGTRARESLIARAASLRAHELHALEASAASATEKMGGPVAFLVVGFVLLIGYPALDTILRL